MVKTWSSRLQSVKVRALKILIFTSSPFHQQTGKASDKPVIMQERNTFKSQSYSFIEVPSSAAGDNVMALHGMKFSVHTLSSRDQELRLAIVQISLSKFHYTRTGKKKWQTVHVCAQGTDWKQDSSV